MSKQNLSEITQEKRKWNVTQIIDQVSIGPNNASSFDDEYAHNKW